MIIESLNPDYVNGLSKEKKLLFIKVSEIHIEIVMKWVNFFKKKNVPFILSNKAKTLTLIKERKA